MQRASLQRVPIETGWQFREAGKENWYPATVPGSVHTDLLKNKVIDDPFYRDNEAKQQWIGKTNWEYRTTFQVTDALLAHKNLELVFEGLDTYADVYLNEKPILKADNMFRTWRVNCADVADKRQQHFADFISITHQRDPTANGKDELPVAGRQRPGRENFTSHSQSSVPVWLGLGAAICDQRHLASSVFGSVGFRAHLRSAY